MANSAGNAIGYLFVFFLLLGVPYTYYLGFVKRKKFPALFMAVWTLLVPLSYWTNFVSPIIVLWGLWSIAGFGYTGWKGMELMAHFTNRALGRKKGTLS
jgi:hypothetical protein